MIAPAVAAAAISPARTPTRIREEITTERKPRGGVHSSEPRLFPRATAERMKLCPRCCP
jgi:hypothetical protein